MIAKVHFAILAFTPDASQDFALGVSGFPARYFLIEISRTLCMHEFRTTQNNPARFLPFPEA